MHHNALPNNCCLDLIEFEVVDVSLMPWNSTAALRTTTEHTHKEHGIEVNTFWYNTLKQKPFSHNPNLSQNKFNEKCVQ